jgi:hypothetical protein
MVYSRLDVNLALYAARWRGHEHRQRALADLDNTSFKAKLELVIPAARQEYGDDPECTTAWQDWLRTADELRCKRNDLMHGRWGIYETRSVVSNIVGLPGLPTQVEVTYTLDELADEVERAVLVSQQFSELSTRWPV